MNKAHTGKALDIVIMEPNIGYCKSGWLPLIVCEKLLLENPDAIHQVFLFNAPMNNPTAVGMIESLELWKTKKLRLMTRMPITEILTFFSDPKKHGDSPVAFLSHQINLPLNYAYFDALYAGFAFVHNSTSLRSMKVGHYYDDLTSGVAQLASLTNSYSAEQYALEAQRVLQSRDPYSEECVNVFKRILEGREKTTCVTPITNTVTYSSIKIPVAAPVRRPNESVLSIVSPSSIDTVRHPIQLIVVSASETRKAILQQQFKELAIPYPIVYLEAKTLDAEAPDYAAGAMTDVERRSIYSTRSHIRAVELAGLPTSPPFSLILEDDVALHKTEFVPVLTQILDSYAKCVEPHSGILSVGWIPCNNYSFYTQLANPTVLNASYTIHQRFTPGTQAYLIKRSKAAEFTPLFKHDSHRALCDMILGKKHPMIAKEGQVAVFDDFGTKLLDQCILFPPLVIEQPNTSLIRGTEENPYWAQFFKGHGAVRDRYWSVSVPPFPDVTRPLVVTYDNNPNDYTNRFFKSLETNKWDYISLGNGEEWRGLVNKIIAYHKYVQTLPENKVIVLSDARDVVCLRSPKAFMEAFLSFHREIVVSMELLCDGKFTVKDDYVSDVCVPLTKYWNYNNISTLPARKFVNSGLIVGRAGALSRCLEWVLSYMTQSNLNNDQSAFGMYINAFPDRVACDIDASVLHSSVFGVNAGLQNIHIQKEDSPTFAELFGRGAFFLHLPGLSAKGQHIVYQQVCKSIDMGVCDKQIREPYGYAEPTWNEQF